MDRMLARDVMSTDLIVVAPKTTVDKIAMIMMLNMISAVPVVDEKFHLLGIVSEGDLVVREDVGTVPRQSWWLKLFESSDELARDYTKAHGRTAADVMTRHVVSVGPDATTAQVADIMRRRGIKRVPVVEDGKLVGMVTRADIVQMVALGGSPAADVKRPDNEIQDEIMSRLKQASWVDTAFLSISVQDHRAEVSGLIASEDRKHALNVLIREVPGVKAVRDTTRVMPLPGL